MELPSGLICLAEAFPLKLYLVGGAVRDAIRGVETTDFDLASALSPDEVRRALDGTRFKVHDSSPKLGTLILTCGDSRFEHTTFRTDSYPEGSGKHRPDGVVFTDDINADCRRRDFRCNAIYYDINEKKIVDPLGGEEDVRRGILRTTRSAREVFCEDGLRIMRLVRFVSVLGFSSDGEAKEAATELSGRLADVSAERVRDELDKTLAGDNSFDALQLASETGALDVILPELAANRNVEQPARFHAYDALRHAFRTVQEARNDVKLAALLHDVGKAEAIARDGNMHRHAEYGAVTAREITKRLKYPNATIAETEILVREHMYDINANAHETKLRRFVARNHAVIDKLIALVRADSAGTGLFSDSPRADRFQAVLDKMKKEGVPFTPAELAINGNDLKKLGFSGKDIGETMGALIALCVDGRLKNDKCVLLAQAERMRRSGRTL